MKIVQLSSKPEWNVELGVGVGMEKLPLAFALRWVLFEINALPWLNSL